MEKKSIKEKKKKIEKFAALVWFYANRDRTDDRTDEFNRLLIKTPLENNAVELWKLGVAIKETKEDESLFEAKKNNEVVEAIKQLLFLMENEGKITIKIKHTTEKKPVLSLNASAIEALKRHLLQTYEAWAVNEEEEEEEETHYCSEDCESYFDLELYGHCEHFEDRRCYKPKYHFPYVLDDENDTDKLKAALETLEQPIEKKPTGRQPSSHRIAYILKIILPMLNIPTKADAGIDTYNSIYDYCEYFDLIPKGTKTTISKGQYERGQYIKGIHDSYEEALVAIEEEEKKRREEHEAIEKEWRENVSKKHMSQITNTVGDVE